MNRTSKMVINMENNALTHEHLPRSQNIFWILVTPPHQRKTMLWHMNICQGVKIWVWGLAYIYINIYLYTYIHIHIYIYIHIVHILIELAPGPVIKNHLGFDIFSRGSREKLHTFICHYYWERGQPTMYIYIYISVHIYMCNFQVHKSLRTSNDLAMVMSSTMVHS